MIQNTVKETGRFSGRPVSFYYEHVEKSLSIIGYFDLNEDLQE